MVVLCVGVVLLGGIGCYGVIWKVREKGVLGKFFRGVSFELKVCKEELARLKRRDGRFR